MHATPFSLSFGGKRRSKKATMRRYKKKEQKKRKVKTICTRKTIIKCRPRYRNEFFKTRSNKKRFRKAAFKY